MFTCAEISHEISALWLFPVQKQPMKYKYCDFSLCRNHIKYQHCNFFLYRKDPWNMCTVTSCAEFTHEISVLWLFPVQKSPMKYEYCDFILPVQISPMKYQHCGFSLCKNDPWKMNTVTSCAEITHETSVLWLFPVQKSLVKYQHCDFVLPVQKSSQVRQLESSMSSKESSLQSSIREWQSRAESAEKHVSGYMHWPTSCWCAVWTLLPHLCVVFCNLKTTAFFFLSF